VRRDLAVDEARIDARSASWTSVKMKPRRAAA
jgi:hypothetical protein